MSRQQGRHILRKLQQHHQIRIQHQPELRIHQLGERHTLLRPQQELLQSRTQIQRQRERHIHRQVGRRKIQQLRIQSRRRQELRRHRQRHQKLLLVQRNLPRPPAFPSSCRSFPWSSCSHSLRGRHGGRLCQRGDHHGDQEHDRELRVHAHPLPPER